MTFRGFLTSVLSLFFGFVFPAYGSITAIESASGADDTQWLVYWLIFSLISISESLLWPVLKWIPLYQELKIALLAWLVLPQTKGALWVYEALLQPGWSFLRRELSKSPAFEKILARSGVEADHSIGLSPAEGLKKREGGLESAVLGATQRLQSELKSLANVSDPSARARAERQFDKDLARLSKIGRGTSGLKEA